MESGLGPAIALLLVARHVRLRIEYERSDQLLPLPLRGTSIVFGVESVEVFLYSADIYAETSTGSDSQSIASFVRCMYRARGWFERAHNNEPPLCFNARILHVW